MDERNYEVYRHTNLKNGKVYIGASRRGWQARWKDKYRSNRKLNADICSTTEADWSHDVLARGLTKEEAKSEEVRQIELHNAVDPDRGYNQRVVSSGVASGGEPWEEERILKISQSQAERWRSSDRGEKGKTKFKHTEESKIKTSAVLSDRCGKRVYCVESGAVYPGIKVAARETGCNHKTIKEILAGARKSTHGYHFRYADGAGEEKNPCVSVVCLETGVVYSSMKEAATATGATSSGISQCCKGIRKICAGYHWRYAE